MKWKTYTTSINPSLPVLVFSFPPVTSEKGFSSFHVRGQSFRKVSHSVFSHFPYAPAVHPPSSCLISLSSMDPSPPHANVLCHPLFSDNFPLDSTSLISYHHISCLTANFKNCCLLTPTLLQPPNTPQSPPIWIFPNNPRKRLLSGSIITNSVIQC